jgi:Protein of unknown function (DUF2804)
MLRGTRPLKRWRYVAVFCEELMACAAIVRVGPAHQSFWAVLTREDSRLRERTRLLLRRGAVELGPGRLRVRDAGVTLDLALEEGMGIQAVCPHGRGYVWTHKQAGIPARGTVAFDGAPPRAIEALAVVDDTAGYHARVTEWWWATGVGVDPTGTPLAFNLVEGVNDPPTEAGRHSPPASIPVSTEAGRHSPPARIPVSTEAGRHSPPARIPVSTEAGRHSPPARIPVSASSERAVWVDGRPHEAATVHFAADLSLIECVDGSRLRFAAEAERSRRERLLLVSSDYRAPFGTFSGTLPGGIELAHGMGVVEHHRARW